ncbi:MAG: hypothetical protein JSC189_000186 [Candidatus Tokpelaia sp. JSC189]|nr:MAG: hypothetical protein JSC189_000186 [Candidatus Tokpelaia sp. JSC189]
MIYSFSPVSTKSPLATFPTPILNDMTCWSSTLKIFSQKPPEPPPSAAVWPRIFIFRTPFSSV